MQGDPCSRPSHVLYDAAPQRGGPTVPYTLLSQENSRVRVGQWGAAVAPASGDSWGWGLALPMPSNPRSPGLDGPPACSGSLPVLAAVLSPCQHLQSPPPQLPPGRQPHREPLPCRSRALGGAGDRGLKQPLAVPTTYTAYAEERMLKTFKVQHAGSCVLDHSDTSKRQSEWNNPLSNPDISM